MANVTTSSKRFSLNINDFWKGLIMAVLGAIVGFVQGVIESGELVFDWKAIWRLALGAAIAYLAKNFFDKPKIVVTDVSDKTIDAVKDGSADVKVTNV